MKRARLWTFFGIAFVLLGAGPAVPQGPAQNPLHPTLQAARQLFYDAVEDKDLIDDAVDRFERLIDSDPNLAVRARAYLGSLKGLRAKHAFFPLTGIIWAQRCLSQLDDARAEAPDDIEVVFLHGVVCHHLPFFFGRRHDEVVDYRHIPDLLPTSHLNYDTWILNDIFNNLIEKSRLSSEEIRRARRLRKELRYPKFKRADTETPPPPGG